MNLVEIEALTPRIRETFAQCGFDEFHYEPFSRPLVSGPPAIQGANAVFALDLEFIAARLREAKPISVLGRII
jgi:hypothetical protein